MGGGGGEAALWGGCSGQPCDIEGMGGIAL